MFGGFYCLSRGRRVRTCGRDSHVQGELFPLQSSQGTCGAGMQQKPLLDLFSLLWMEGLSAAVPSLPAGSSSGCEPRSICRALLGQLLPHCPSPTFSSAGSDCSSPKATFSLPECPPLPWQCHLQSLPATWSPYSQGGQPPFCLPAESMHGSFSPPNILGM